MPVPRVVLDTACVHLSGLMWLEYYGPFLLSHVPSAFPMRNSKVLAWEPHWFSKAADGEEATKQKNRERKLHGGGCQSSLQCAPSSSRVYSMHTSLNLLANLSKVQQLVMTKCVCNVCVWGGGRGGGFPAGRTDNRIAAQPIQRYGTELQSTGSCQISPRVFDSLQVVKKEGRAVAGLSGMSHLMGA